MREEENIARVKRAWQAIQEHDYDTLRLLLTEDAVFSGPVDPEIRGADAIIASFKESDEMGVTMEGEVGNEGLFAHDDQVVSLTHVKLSRGARTVDTHVVHSYDLRGGRASRVTVYTSEPRKLLEFMS